MTSVVFSLIADARAQIRFQAKTPDISLIRLGTLPRTDRFV